MGAKPAKKLEDAPIVVIIGGGYAGTKLAKALDGEFNVVLIDRKDYFLHNVGTPRGMVDTEFMKKLMIPYTALLKNGHVVKGQVEKITDTEVHLQGQESPITGFKYLILATGTSYAFPYKVPQSEAEDVIPQYAEIRQDFKIEEHCLCWGRLHWPRGSNRDCMPVPRDKGHYCAWPRKIVRRWHFQTIFREQTRGAHLKGLPQRDFDQRGPLDACGSRWR